MPYEDKTQMGSGPIRRASTDTVKGEVAPGVAIAQGELVAFMSQAQAYYQFSQSATLQTATFAASDTVTLNSHPFAVGDAVIVTNSTPANVPSPYVNNTVYYVVNVPNANTFKLSATPGGSAITAAGAGTGNTQVKKVNATVNYPGLVIGASAIDTSIYSAAKTEFRTQLLGAAAIKKTADDPDRTITIFTHPVVEFLTDDTAGLGVGAAVKLKDNSTKFASPQKWTLATLGTDELGVVIEQAPIRYPDYAYAASVKAGTPYSLNALAAPVKVAAVLRTRFN